MQIIFMHQHKNMLINGKRKERKIEYLLHERALRMNEYFRNQRSLFTSSRSKIPYLQKEVPKAETYRNVRRIEKSEEKSPRKRGSERVLNVGRPPLFIEVGMLKKNKQKTYGVKKKKRFG